MNENSSRVRLVAGADFMTNPEPGISFRTLLAYTDYLAHRWIKYFQEHPAALEVDLGGKAGSIRNLVGHIVQVEQFFAGRLMQEETPRPKPESLPLEELERFHQQAQEKLTRYITSASEEELSRTQAFGPVTSVSSRKIMTQTVLHSIHHWAQVAMEVRQAGFPTEKPQDIIITDVME
jgi:uncharacterized damage-inducible protein DinB